MKRYDGLFDGVASFANLLQAAKKARKGCGNTPESCRFFFYLESELLELRRQLLDGSFQPGEYRYFIVNDPKRRTIAVAPFRDRVAHHAIVNVLEPIYERCFIFDSYATRAGKGTHAAIRRAQGFCRRWPWFVKTDVHKFFDSVDHEALLGILARKIRDRRLLDLLERFVRNTPTPGKGLPIGNLTSQFLANVYLDPLDHMIKERLRVKGYVRYMDDFVLFAHSRTQLMEWLDAVEEYLDAELRLGLKPGATHLNRTGHGVSFLGMRIYPGCIRVRGENKRRSLRKLAHTHARWRSGHIPETRMVQGMESVVAHLTHFCPALPVRPLGQHP